MSNITVGGGGGGSSSLTVGTTTVTGGTDGYALTDNAGVLGDARIRTILTGNVAYYVNSSTGSDSNPGTALLPFATLQYAMDHLQATLDGGGHSLTINCAGAGPYFLVEDSSVASGWVGFDNVTILGAGSTVTAIQDLQFSQYGGPNASVNLNTTLNFDQVKFTSSFTGANTFDVQILAGTVGNINFGVPVGDIAFSTSGVQGPIAHYARTCVLQLNGNIAVTCGTQNGLFALDAGTIFNYGTITVVGTPTFSTWMYVTSGAWFAEKGSYTNPNAATGLKFIATANGTIENGFPGDPTTWPGSIEGSCYQGGSIQYLEPTVFTPLTGGTVALTKLQRANTINPAGTLAALTVHLPDMSSGLIENFQTSAFCTHTITALTVSTVDGSSIVGGAPTTFPFAYAYSLINNQWLPIDVEPVTSGGGGLTVNSTTISGGAAGQLLYDDGTKLQETVDVLYNSTTGLLTLNPNTANGTSFIINDANTSYTGFTIQNQGTNQWALQGGPQVLPGGHLGFGFVNLNAGQPATNSLAFGISGVDNSMQLNVITAAFNPANPFLFRVANAALGYNGFLADFNVLFQDSAGTFAQAYDLRIYTTDATAGAISAEAQFYTTLSGSGNLGLKINDHQGVEIGNAALATSATDGFLYIPTCAGTPTGTPKTVTGRIAMVYDTTNHQFWFYDGGGWKQPKTPAGAAIVTWQ